MALLEACSGRAQVLPTSVFKSLQCAGTEHVSSFQSVGNSLYLSNVDCHAVKMWQLVSFVKAYEK